MCITRPKEQALTRDASSPKRPRGQLHGFAIHLKRPLMGWLIRRGIGCDAVAWQMRFHHPQVLQLSGLQRMLPHGEHGELGREQVKNVVDHLKLLFSRQAHGGEKGETAGVLAAEEIERMKEQ